VTLSASVNDEKIRGFLKREDRVVPHAGVVIDALTIAGDEAAQPGGVKFTGRGDHHQKRAVLHRHKGLTAQRVTLHKLDGQWEGQRGCTKNADQCVTFFAHFIGNYPPSASIDVCLSDAEPGPGTSWTRILPSQPLQPGSNNLFEVSNDFAWNYIRLNIYPDGGVARLRVYGEILPDWEKYDESQSIDLIALQHGGRALMCNDEHFGSMHNLIKPTPPINMGDGWETRRRREPGYDWAIFSLGRLGVVEKIVLETTFFK
ncbi:unnamed protein product, partial [Cyprideis torosa]